MVKENAYLIIGGDQITRRAKWEGIKKRALSRSDIAEFNQETLSAAGLNPRSLEEALARLPAAASRQNDGDGNKKADDKPKRVLVIRGVENLSAPCQKIIADYLLNPSRDTVVILEGRSYPDKKIKQNNARIKIITGNTPRPLDAFSLGRAIKEGRQNTALDIIKKLLSEGEQPEKILGAIIWQWGQLRGQLSEQKINKGLRALLNTDLNIKSNRLKKDTALELLTVKLSLLTSC